jgi:trans-aconitate methyltransferase
VRQAATATDPLVERKLIYFDRVCKEQIWSRIWGNPRADAPEDDLVALSGAKHTREGNVFDEEAYNKFVDRLVGLIDAESEWIYEIGAGAGAMLSNIRKRMPDVPIAGCDNSAYLCGLAPAELNISNHSAHRAAYEGAIPFGRAGKGVILTVGVLMYFPDHFYADFVLTGLLRGFPQATVILSEVPDLAKKYAVESVRGHTGHTFYPKDFFRIYDEAAEIIDYELRGSVNSGSRYIVVLNRR